MSDFSPEKAAAEILSMSEREKIEVIRIAVNETWKLQSKLEIAVKALEEISPDDLWGGDFYLEKCPDIARKALEAIRK